MDICSEYEGLLFNENNKTDELEVEKREKMSQKMKSNSIEGEKRMSEEYGGSHPKLN